MEVFKTIKSLQGTLSEISQKKSLGLVPTMGALHQGHLSLLNRAKNECDFTIATIFVNPTQFDKKEDLDNYPNTLTEDLQVLESIGCDFVFVPSIDEIYHKNSSLETFDFEGLDEVMEGRFRPGHFDGVATIVKKLFLIIQPQNAYFGEKDFQQLLIIKKMVALEKLPVQVISCKTYREKDGLAMSSRNIRLTREQRMTAPLIYAILEKCRKQFADNDLQSIKSFVKNSFEKNQFLELEYFEITDNHSLKIATSFDPNIGYHAFIAVFAGKVRLIDNIALN